MKSAGQVAAQCRRAQSISTCSLLTYPVCGVDINAAAQQLLLLFGWCLIPADATCPLASAEDVLHLLLGLTLRPSSSWLVAAVHLSYLAAACRPHVFYSSCIHAGPVVATRFLRRGGRVHAA